MHSFIADLPESWHEVFRNEAENAYFEKLLLFIAKARKEYTIYPSAENTFTAFKLTPFSEIRVVILGQDPYHNPHQAHGLAFSVPEGIKIPPSLKNIFKELQTDLQIPAPTSGNLTNWANRGVLLLNSVLTVRENKPGSHANKGWAQFTDAVIKTISDKKESVVYILWGNYAQTKAKFINTDKHLILAAPHPSPLSAYQGFFGSKPFSKTNNFLVSKKVTPINWAAISNDLRLEL